MPKKLTIEHCRKLAEAKGGKCLSDVYVNNWSKMLWECKFEHRWKSTLHHIKDSHSWCNICYINGRNEKLKMPNALNVANQIALERSGKCLSTKYTNIHTKMLWECKFEHRWKSTLDCVKNRKQWCPQCAIQERADKKRTTVSEIINICDNKIYKIVNFNNFKTQKDSIVVQCTVCNDISFVKIINLKRSGFGCKKCRKINSKLAQILRNQLRKMIKKKNSSAIDNVGCSIVKLRKHLEDQFHVNPKTGEMMNWKNYGFYGWHIDHIMPISIFNLTDKKQLLIACNYTNLQPLWAEDNLKKGARIL